MWSHTKKNVACVPVRLFFWHSIPLIFTLLAASISQVFDRGYKIFMFFLQRNSSSFVYFSFALTFSRSFIHVSEDKNLVKKKTWLCH